ncbi:MAG TPA: SGNH/GDSL hydrolase family protein [Pseudonocardia sp.]|nr:SGNH/GDSL hydrolase family protein [Pseudonocardia sp.]
MALAVGLGASLAVLAPGTGVAADSSSYVALGDSYTAGPVIPIQTGRPLGCLRSTSNYPSLIRRELRPRSFVDASCSGATTKDMTASQAVPGGSNPPQLSVLTRNTTLVSLGIGGNDIGFAKIITSCAERSTTKLFGSACRDEYSTDGHDQLADRIDRTSEKVANVLDEIARRAPKATVLVVGYPTILPDSGPGCYPIVPFSPGDVAYLRQTEKRLNAMLAREAARAGARYVDTYTPSIGHDICKLPGTKWVEGLVPTAPAAPVHPNARGMRNSADAALDVIGDSSRDAR